MRTGPHNDGRDDGQTQHVTGDLCVEDYERICADMARPAVLA
jgi:hypothetical protein